MYEKAKDPIKAVVLFDKACKGNIMEACAKLGRFYADGTGVAKDVTKAAALFEQACTGEYMQNDTPDAKDPLRVGSPFTSGATMGCYYLGDMYADGKGVSKDVTKAAARYQRICTKDSLGCVELGILYARGKGITKDVTKATALFEEACTHEDMDGCYNLGVCYERGVGVTKDVTKAAALFKQACKDGVPHACKR